MNRRTTYSLFLKGDLKMKTLQRIGKAFMVPVALLPIAGLLLGIGASMQQSLLNYLPFNLLTI